MTTKKTSLDAQNGAKTADKPSERPPAQEPELVPITDEQIKGVDEKDSSLALIGESVELSLQSSKDSLLTRDQILAIRARTPQRIIKSVSVGGGTSANYVPSAYYQRKLNFVFGYGSWSFVVMKSEIIEDHALVQGKLLIPSKNIELHQFGGHPVARVIVGYEKENVRISKDEYWKNHKGDRTWLPVYGGPVDLGNTMKAAATDCFKKCCSMLGIFSDVYSPNEFAEAPKELSVRKEIEILQSNIDKLSAKELTAIKKKIEKSDKYTDEERKQIIEYISDREKQL